MTDVAADPNAEISGIYRHVGARGTVMGPIYRLCLQSEDTISMYFVPGARHLSVFREQAEKAIANAEYVIEGELLPDVRVIEDQNSGTGKAMTEFPGYTGPANPSLPVFNVKAVTHRKNPILQTCIGPSEEHVNMAGIPTEASILQMVEKAMPGKLQNVYAHCSGGGKYMAVMQFKKTVPSDKGRQ